MIDSGKLDRIFQYTLALAARADDRFDRELGPIHLLKIAYLADLAYAERHGGNSYTGVPWRFHHYGPWSVEAFSRVNPSLHALGAQERIVTSRYGDDSARWSIPPQDSDDILRSLDRELPSEVVSAVLWAVRKFGNDTSSLLHFVYQTPPMLNAAPEDLLDLSLVAKPASTCVEQPSGTLELSTKQLKKRREAIAQFREQLREKRARDSTKPPQLLPASPPPKYDDEFQQGVAWLDNLAGSPPPMVNGTVSFSDEIWTNRDPGRE